VRGAQGNLRPYRDHRAYIRAMCNAYNLRHRNDALIDIARAMQLVLDDLPEFPPRAGSASKNGARSFGRTTGGALAWSWALWGLIPFRRRERPPYPSFNARSDKLGSWPWKAVQRKRCLVPAS
jgi:putative SOS response-associated peptidase YedK